MTMRFLRDSILKIKFIIFFIANNEKRLLTFNLDNFCLFATIIINTIALTGEGWTIEVFGIDVIQNFSSIYFKFGCVHLNLDGHHLVQVTFAVHWLSGFIAINTTIEILVSRRYNLTLLVCTSLSCLLRTRRASIKTQGRSDLLLAQGLVALSIDSLNKNCWGEWGVSAQRSLQNRFIDHFRAAVLNLLVGLLWTLGNREVIIHNGVFFPIRCVSDCLMGNGCGGIIIALLFTLSAPFIEEGGIWGFQACLRWEVLAVCIVSCTFGMTTSIFVLGKVAVLASKSTRICSVFLRYAIFASNTTEAMEACWTGDMLGLELWFDLLIFLNGVKLVSWRSYLLFLLLNALLHCLLCLPSTRFIVLILWLDVLLHVDRWLEHSWL